MNSQEPTHASEIGTLHPISARQRTDCKTHNHQTEKQDAVVQCAQLHRLTRSLPARGNVDLRQFDGQGEGTNLREVKDPQPLMSAARIARTQEQRHHDRHDPEKHKHVTGPQRRRLFDRQG